MLFLIILAMVLTIVVLILAAWVLLLRRENQDLQKDLDELNETRDSENKAFLTRIQELRDDLHTAEASLNEFEGAFHDKSIEVEDLARSLEVVQSRALPELSDDSFSGGTDFVVEPGSVWAQLAEIGARLGFASAPGGGRHLAST